MNDYSSMGLREDGSAMLRVRVLALLAAALRIQFKIGGQPFGASYARAINHDYYRSRRDVACGSAGPAVGA